MSSPSSFESSRKFPGRYFLDLKTCNFLHPHELFQDDLDPYSEYQNLEKPVKKLFGSFIGNRVQKVTLKGQALFGVGARQRKRVM